MVASEIPQVQAGFLVFVEGFVFTGVACLLSFSS